MHDEETGQDHDRPLRYEEIDDPTFQKRWREARHLTGEEVDLAFQHGFEARDRFAGKTFEEVEGYLRESWDAMAPTTGWEQVSDIVHSGYDRYRGAGLDSSTDTVDEALERFPYRTIGGSATGGTMGERTFLGGSEPVSDYDGEGGPPVEDGKRVRD